MDKVLILSGETDHAKTLKSGLDKMHQFEVNIATRGEDAIALFDKIKFSVFVTDISPPGMDALDLLSYMSQNRPNTPCIVMTDHGKPWFKEKMAQQSFLYHLEKPFKISSLATSIFVGLNLRDEGKNLKGMTIASVLPLIEILQKTCRMETKSKDRNKGYLYFNKGVLIDAHFKDLRGEVAAQEIAKWERITIKFTELPRRRTRTRVKTHLMDIAGASWDKNQVVEEPPDDVIPLSPETEVEKNDPSTPGETVSATVNEQPDDEIPLCHEIEVANNTSPAATRKTVSAKVNEPPDDVIQSTREIKKKKTVPADSGETVSATDEKFKDEVPPGFRKESIHEDKISPTQETRQVHKEYSLDDISNLGMDMYLEYYQLAQKPFQINTDPSFLWFGEKQKEALATLKYGIQENKSCLLLTGDVGVGKTTIVKALLQGLGENDLAVVINDPVLDTLDFFNYVARSFGLSGDFTTKGAFLDAFGDFLLKSYYQGKRVLLIIDECQLLSPSFLAEIRLFLNFEKKGSTLINIFFVGQLEFNDILLLPENRAIRQRIAVNYNIPPLSLKETEKYIEYRLAVAGTNRKIFKASAIREIFYFSKGHPRLINIIADRALLTGYINSTKHIKKGIIKECASELDISLVSKAALQKSKKT
ncbi:MAG: AAA family ATPase [Desulfobacteraceae bacterium]|nr:AAA family ATPase [Desulfobacteraceae bacterium]MBC2754785.1 AAA family ATPase [Desulfobacteraceae bacterium]